MRKRLLDCDTVTSGLLNKLGGSGGVGAMVKGGDGGKGLAGLGAFKQKFKGSSDGGERLQR